MSTHLHHWDALEKKDVISGFQGRFLHTPNLTLSLWNVEPGALLPEHNHPHEQITQVLEGTFELTIDGIKNTMQAGSVAIIPPHARHSGMAVTSCRLMDIFFPVREDYRDGNLRAVLNAASASQ
ncbi:MAG: cupin domain-containing protein [Alphaproteobacteria bacterium]|nr:cupin domain-containing protein [Alphaproteobacteria bacterium]